MIKREAMGGGAGPREGEEDAEEEVEEERDTDDEEDMENDDYYNVGGSRECVCVAVGGVEGPGGGRLSVPRELAVCCVWSWCCV